MPDCRIATRVHSWQYATEQPDAPLEIRSYPGADGRFTLYADDNDTYAYGRGQSARTTLTWNDRDGTSGSARATAASPV